MERRKDTKGRVLHDKESQRSDGRYCYQYTDIDGKRRVIYSWRLTASDKTPNGKKKDLSLREKEDKIKEALSKGIISNGGGMTVLELAEKYVSQKKGVKISTRGGYEYRLNIVKKDDYGYSRIDKIKQSDAKKWMIKLYENGKSYRTIVVFKSFLKAAFKLAIDDDLILKNPFDFDLSSVIKDNTKKRTSITKEQQIEFLEFIKNNRFYSKYYNAIYILFETGIRISELCGLTIDDIDFKDHTICIRRQVLLDNRKISGQCKRYVDTLKSESGLRYIPLKDDVAECFKRELEIRKKVKVEPVVDGVHGFIFLDKNGMPDHSITWDQRFTKIVNRYNKSNTKHLPKITPHICRHTFCSNQMNAGLNVKILQYLMGHSNVSMTMDTYSHVHFEDVRLQFLGINNGTVDSTVTKTTVM